jgi:hypothetical protein
LPSSRADYTQKKGEGQLVSDAFSCWRPRFLIAEKLLRGLPDLLEQPAMIARLIDRRLQFFAQLGQSFDSLTFGEILTQRVSRPSLIRRLVVALICTEKRSKDQTGKLKPIQDTSTLGLICAKLQLAPFHWDS